MSADRCSSCQAPLRLDARFCTRCGAANVPASSAQCPRCQNLVRPDVRFCSKCGQSLTAVSPPQPEGTLLPPAQPSAPPPAPVAASPAAFASSRTPLRHWLISSFLALTLILALGAVYLWDDNAAAAPVVEVPVLPTPVPPTPTPGLAHPDPVVEFGFLEDGRFGLATTLGDPDRDDDDEKLLTFDLQGHTNNTRIFVDGDTPLFGDGDGRFTQSPSLQDGTLTATWVYNDIWIQQTIVIVQSPSTRLIDTLRIEYQIENQDSIAHDVGLRLMMDTLIGDNDGVPFVVPGRSGIVDRAVTLTGNDIPDFIQALEIPDLVNPGVIVNLTLKGSDATPPDRIDLAGWYAGNAAWNIIGPVGGSGSPLRRGGQSRGEPDSAIGLYYNPTVLQPDEKRAIVTFYGLGAISSTSSGNPSLSLTFARQVTVGDTFWVVAMVVNPVEGQTVRLALPAGLSLDAGHTAELAVTFNANDHFTQISWLVQADEVLDNGNVEVTLSPDNITEAQTITVTARGVTR